MYKAIVVTAVAILLGLPTLASAQSAQSIFEEAQTRQLERWEGVDVYIVTQSIMGSETQSYFQRTLIKDDAGNSQTLFLPVRNSGRSSGQCMGAQEMTPEQLEAFAAATEMTGNVAGDEIEDGLEEAGLPRGLLAASGSDPTATFDPRVMMGANSQFLRGAAQAKRELAAEDSRVAADGQEMANQMAQFAQNAKLVGTEKVDGRNAFHLRAGNVGHVQKTDDGEFRMDSMSLWIDTTEYVPLRMKIDGTLTADGQTKPMTIENVQSDYRSVPGSRMYESYKRVMNISGMMTPEQEAQMGDAAKQMAELEQQMASMPASQRQMMEKMMGPQLEMMRSMSSGGGFKTEVLTTSITVNPQMAGDDGQPCPSSGGRTIGTGDPDIQLTKTIQVSLASLGYDTGTTGGTMNKQTAIAISQFQASRGMEVTGQPSPQLAGVLSAAVDAQ